MEVMYLLKQITDRMKHRGDEDMKRLGLTFSQTQVLMILLHNGGRMPQKEIECELRVAHPTVVGLITRLKNNGFVTTEIDPTDRRNRIVSVTPKTEANFEELNEHRNHFNDRVRQAFTDEEFEELQRLLEKLLTRINETR